MSVPSRVQVIKARNDFRLSVAICLGAIVVVHFLPKGFRPSDPRRLFYTMVFFSAALLLCAQLLQPRRAYLQRLYAWRFSDAPKPVERAWQAYLYSLDQVITVFVYLALGILGSTFLATLACWFPRVDALSVAYNPVWWISMMAMALYPLLGGFLFSELTQRYRALHEQTAFGRDYQPRSLGRDGDAEREVVPLELGEKQSFRAAGMDWQWRDFTSNCVVLGMTGTGKTVCVLNALVEGILGAADRAHEVPSALILDPKGDFDGKIQTLCRRYGRERDLVVLDPEAPGRSIHWNPFDSTDDELELAGRFAAVLETLGMQGGDDSFWLDSARRFLRHAIALIRLTNPPGVPPSFADIQALVGSSSAIAARTDQLDVTRPDCEACLSFFVEWVEMAHNQRSGIQSHVTNMIDPFLMEPYATIFSGPSTYRIGDLLRDGKILYVHMPLAYREEMSRTIGTFIKLEYYREVLKALDKSRPSFFLCDEFQQFFTVGQRRGDADFFERSRQSNHANIIVTQNIPGLLRQTPRREPVINLLGNCATKIFLRNTDEDTNEYASKLFGEEIMSMGGMSAAGGKRLSGRLVSASDQFVRRVSPDTFTDLAVPAGHPDRHYCESLIFLGARAEGARSVRKFKWPIHVL